jgi:hypothetical protein
MARYREVNTLSAADAEYVAGLADGEGTIALSRKHAGQRSATGISISNTERAILELV